MYGMRRSGLATTVGLRLIAFALSLLVAVGALEHGWEMATLLLVLGAVSLRDAYGMVFVVVEGILLSQAPEASPTLLILAPVLAGVALFRPFRLLAVSSRGGLRIVLFVLAVLLAATHRIDPTWHVFAVMLVMGLISMKDVYGLAFVVALAVLLTESPNVSQPVLIIAAILAGLSASHLIIEASRPRGFERGRRQATFRLRRGALTRLQRWSQAGES